MDSGADKRLRGISEMECGRFDCLVSRQTNHFDRQNDDPCQTEQGDEYPERPGCANKGMGLETDGKLCLNGGYTKSYGKGRLCLMKRNPACVERNQSQCRASQLRSVQSG
jgi:hypothetical protein